MVSRFSGRAFLRRENALLGSHVWYSATSHMAGSLATQANGPVAIVKMDWNNPFAAPRRSLAPPTSGPAIPVA
jgi:hypothetical protein